MVRLFPPHLTALLPDSFSSLVPRCRRRLCRDHLQDLDRDPLWYLDGRSVCLPVVGLMNSAHLDPPRSGVAGILLTHLGDNGQSSRTYPLPPLLSRISLIGHVLQLLLSPPLSSLLLSATLLAPPPVRPRNVPFLSKRTGTRTTNIVYQVYIRCAVIGAVLILGCSIINEFKVSFHESLPQGRVSELSSTARTTTKEEMDLLPLFIWLKSVSPGFNTLTVSR